MTLNSKGGLRNIMNDLMRYTFSLGMGKISNSKKAEGMKRSSVPRTARFGEVLVLLLSTGVALAEPTPMDTALSDDSTTLIECNVRDPKENMAIFTKIAGGSENPLKSTKTEGYHYNLYIPKGYNVNKDFRYPCLFISSPGGNAKMGEMAERLKNDQWVVVMLQESKNGSPDWLRNFIAAHDDVVERVRIAKGAKFATGQSGGARCSSVYAILRPGMAGIVCQAAGFAYEFEPARNLYESYPPEILVAGSFGDGDFNLFESLEILRSLKKSRVQVRYFMGGHAWCPKRSFNSLMDWIEESLFLASTKPVNSMGPRPVASQKSTGSKGGSKAEPLGADAFQWYLRKCKVLLDEAQGNAARSLIIERLLTAVANGKLEQNKGVAAEAQAWKSELTKLKQTKEVIDFNKTARKAYADAQLLESASMANMKRGTPEYKKMKMSPSEKQALKRVIAAYRAIEQTYPDSPFAMPAKDAADSWDVALSKAE